MSEESRCPECGEELNTDGNEPRCVSCGWHPGREELDDANADADRDLMALYERGEISAEALADGQDGDEDRTEGVQRFKGDGDDVYLSLNVLGREEGRVTFRIGIQWVFGMEFLGFRNFISTQGRATRHGTMCKLRTANGVTLVSMCGAPAWCPDGWYYSLARADHLGRDEDEVSKGVFLVDDEREKSQEVMGPGMAEQMREFYARLSGSTAYDPDRHNQVVRGKVLKVMGPDKVNGEVTVSEEDFEAIEFAVRAYNKYMNDNAAPEEFNRHVARMIRADRLLARPDTPVGKPSSQPRPPLEDALEEAERGNY